MAVHILLAAAVHLAPAAPPAAAASAPVEFPDKEDLPVPPVQGMGNMGGARLALPVAIRFADDLPAASPHANRANGQVRGTTAVPVQALSRYALGVSRSFFQEASWQVPARKGKGRELVITSIKVLSQQGPLYEVQVSVDRVEDGKRLGTASGMGMTAPDRTNDRMAAAFAPGLLGVAVAHDASRAKPGKDQAAIMQATLQAFERATVQLGAYWAGEQAQEEAIRKARGGK